MNIEHAHDLAALEPWERYEGTVTVPAEGDVYIYRFTESSSITRAGQVLAADEGDYLALCGTLDESFQAWPVAASELPNSDGRMIAANLVAQGGGHV